MEAKMTAIEMTETVDEHHLLRLDDVLPIRGPVRVRVLVLYPLSEDWYENEWLHAGANSPAFEFLRESGQDIYSLNDGKPFDDEV